MFKYLWAFFAAPSERFIQSHFRKYILRFKQDYECSAYCNGDRLCGRWHRVRGDGEGCQRCTRCSGKEEL